MLRTEPADHVDEQWGCDTLSDVTCVERSAQVEGSTWRLSLFGAWQLSCAGRVLCVGVNTQRLLALLALRGACDRSYLAGQLWPDSSESHAQDNLRATLCRLHRRGLTEVLQSTTGAMSLAGHVILDVSTLTTLASAVLDGARASPDRATLRALGGSDLLVGWDDDWLVIERERLRQLRLQALEFLSAQLVAAGSTASAVEAALVAVAMDPLRESAHRALIQAHLAHGNTVDAIRQLSRLRYTLHEELGVEPSMLVSSLVASPVPDMTE